MKRFVLLCWLVTVSPILGGTGDAAAAWPGCINDAHPVAAAATIDGAGGSVVAWEETCSALDGHVASDVVATASTALGAFPAAEPISPAGQQADLSQIASDAAGDTWVVGDRDKLFMIPRPPSDSPEPDGVWAALRTRGAGFAPAVVLAETGWGIQVAINASGAAVIAWNDATGTRIVTADAAGRLSSPVLETGLVLGGVGIDASGTVTVAGIRAGDRVEIVSAAPGHAFAAARVVFRAHRRCEPTFPPDTPPLHDARLAVAPSGAALLIWGATLINCASAQPTDIGQFAYRPSRGRFGAARQFGTGYISSAGDPGIDARGRALIGWEAFSSRRGARLEASRVNAAGHLATHAQQLSGDSDGGTIAVAANGRAVVFSDHSATRAPVLFSGSTSAGFRAAQTLAAPGIDPPAVTGALDGAGDTLLVWGNPLSVAQFGRNAFAATMPAATPHPIAVGPEALR